MEEEYRAGNPETVDTPVNNEAPATKKEHTGIKFLIGMLLGMMLTVIVVGILVKTGTIGGTKTVSKGLEGILSDDGAKKLQIIHDQVEKYYLFDKEDVNTDDGILKGYVDSFGDPYTVYYTAEEYASIMESTTGVYSGIGVVVSQNASTGVITVVKPYTTGPGYEAGMRAEDIITAVNGEEVTGIDLQLVVTDIKGPEGTNVDITIYRPSTGEYMDLTVTRRLIEIETISHEMLEDNIGYIQMDSFEDVTFKQFKEAYEDLKAQGMKGLVVDIRDNGGGLLRSVCDIVDYLLPKGIITYTIDIEDKKEVYTSDDQAALDVPLVVLVNGNSASASEIFTAAIQDHEAGQIVGTQTFGKGIVQFIFELGDGSAVKMTYSRYYTPKGVCIHGEGITPDVIVNPDNTTEEDEQLEEAKKLLREQMN